MIFWKVKVKNIVAEENRSNQLACYKMQIAKAADFLMFQKHGGAGGVTNHLVGILNNVQTNWDDEFAHSILYELQSPLFISSCSSCDPWTSSTSAGTLLNSFTSWGPGGFGVAHDVGQLWTARELRGSLPIGIAWLNSICSGSQYNCCQDFTGGGQQLRVLSSHELGHNWSCPHDGSGSPTIMAPSVNGSNTWSGLSISRVNNKLSQGSITGPFGCLSPCVVIQPPSAAFFASSYSVCVGEPINFSDGSQQTIRMHGPGTLMPVLLTFRARLHRDHRWLKIRATFFTTFRAPLSSYWKHAIRVVVIPKHNSSMYMRFL